MTEEEKKLIDGTGDISTPSQATEMDALDAYLSGYKEKMDVPPANPALSNGALGVPGTQPPAGGASTPFISHDPSQNPQQEFYKRGAKKGQPKPPKKGLAPPLTPSGTMGIQATALISGALFITMIDILLPLIIATLNNWKKGSVKINAEDMKLTASQKTELAPIGDGVVREYKINANPGALLLVAGIGMYSMAFLTAKSKAKERIEKERKQKEKEEQEKNRQQQNGQNNPFIYPN